MLMAIAAIVIGAILIGFLLFSGTIKWIIIGIGVIIGAFYITGQAIRGEFTTPKVLFILVLLGIGVFLVFGSGFLSQSYISVDSVNVGEDGKVYWLMTGTADNIDEGYMLIRKPSKYTHSDGTTITPQNALSIKISKGESNCEYLLQEETKKVFTFFNYKYDILSNPERNAEIIVEAEGVRYTLDGTIVDSEPIQDSDGKGSVIIKSIGLIAGKVDCPNYENVAVIYDKNDVVKYVVKSDLDTKLEKVRWFPSPTNIFNYFFAEVRENDQFVNGFKSYPKRVDGVIRGDINIGNGAFTLTADQDYFNSVVLLPPKDADPEIDDINIPNEITVGADQSMSVTIRNKEDSEGDVVVKVNSIGLSINPSRQNILLKNSKTLYFTTRASTIDGDYEVCVEACSVSQFGSENCDNECEDFKIVKKAVDTCGDGTCQSYENSATCAEDCAPVGCETDSDCDENFECKSTKCVRKPETCEWYEKPYAKDVTDCGFLDWKDWAPLVDCETYTEKGCKTAGWVYLGMGGIVIVLLVTIIVLLRKPRHKPTKRRKKK